MVQVYLMNIADLPDPKEKNIVMRELPQKEQDRILAFSHEKGRKQCLGARLLQQYVLAQQGLCLEDVTYGEHHKPEVSGLQFNLSHSYDYVVCAVGDKPVGCDIEKIGPARMHVAKRFFHAQELQYLNTFTGREQDEEFFRLWTIKESYIKMTGEGMYLPLNKFVCLISGEGIHMLYEDQDGSLQRPECFVKEYEVPGYKLTVCAEEDTFAKHCLMYSGHYINVV